MSFDITGKIKNYLSTLDEVDGIDVSRIYNKEKNKLVTYGTIETMLNVEKIEDLCQRVPGMKIFPTSLPYGIHEITLTCPKGDTIQRLQFFPKPNEERVNLSGYVGDCELIISILKNQLAPDICSSADALNYEHFLKKI